MSNPAYTPADNATILRLRAEGHRWVTITFALGKGHTPTGVEKRWHRLMVLAREAAAEAAEAARPKVRIVIPLPPTPKEPQPQPQPKPSATYWPDGWTIKPPTKAQLMGKK